MSPAVQTTLTQIRLEKIISGGQTGADMGGLLAGRDLGLETGGTAPRGWVTDAGRNPDLQLFGLIEGPPDPRTYVIRTLCNVVNSDATLVFGRTDSPGVRLTLRFCREQRRPALVNPETPERLLAWLASGNVYVLNVAGNRERLNPGIERRTRDFLVGALKGPLIHRR